MNKNIFLNKNIEKKLICCGRQDGSAGIGTCHDLSSIHGVSTCRKLGAVMRSETPAFLWEGRRIIPEAHGQLEWQKQETVFHKQGERREPTSESRLSSDLHTLIILHTLSNSYIPQ